jgi:peptide deformylase
MSHSSLKKQYPLIIGENHPILRTVCVAVDHIDKDIKQFARHLISLMHMYHGVWLASPQIGQSIRIIATSQRKTDKKGQIKGSCIAEHIMINPVIIEHSIDTHIDLEGCLSLPGIQGHVERYQTIIVQYKDTNNRTHTDKFHGLDARIVQHEIDHLDGILYIDKLVWPLVYKPTDDQSFIS